MDLKEKILNTENNKPDEMATSWITVDRQAALKAMEELSKIVAIAFGKFISTHRLDFQPASPDGYWIGLDMEYYSTEALYEQFIQSKEYHELMDAK